MNSSITSLEAIDSSQARFLLHDGSSGAVVTGLSADCCLLRSCVWALSRGVEPVHVLRVVNLALAVSDVVDDIPQRREELRRILEELCEVRDLVSLPEGRWIPAPTREVLLPESDERLLVGGLPSSVLPMELRRRIVHHGPYRRMIGAALGNALELPQEPMASWTGGPAQDLESWSEQILNVDLIPYQEPQDRSRLRVYAPELSVGSLQIKRWFDRLGDLSGRYLARRERVFGAVEYRIVEVRRGSVVATNDLGSSEARRLMYALDWRARRSIEIQCENEANFFSIVIRNELPGPELRLFGAIGILKVPDEAYYPRTWRFGEAYRKNVLDTLQKLRITVIGKVAGRVQHDRVQ